MSSLVAEPARDGSDADVLVRIALQHSAGLLVVGAYGHSRLQEWAFGGVTRELLRDQRCRSSSSTEPRRGSGGQGASAAASP